MAITRVPKAPELRISEATATPPSGGFNLLSERRQQVARLLLQGHPNKVIARELDISEGTVKAHVSAIYQLIGARNRVDAVTLAIKAGFMQIGKGEA